MMSVEDFSAASSEPLTEKCNGTPCHACLVLLCGLPASGKTTLAKTLVQHGLIVSKVKQTVKLLHVCYDDILQEDEKLLAASNSKDRCVPENSKDAQCTSWKRYRQTLVLSIDRCIEQFLSHQNDNMDTICNSNCHSDIDWRVWSVFHKTVTLGMNSHPQTVQSGTCLVLLIDDNLYYKSMRYEYYQLARKYNIGFCQIHMQCTVASAIQDNTSRVNPVPAHIIKEMAARFEVPQPDVNAWEKFSLTVNRFSTVDVITWMCKIETLIDMALEHPAVWPVDSVDPAVRVDSQRIVSESLVHQVDQILRRLIGDSIQQERENGLCSSAVRQFASDANAIKVLLLKKIRKQLVDIPDTLATTSLTDVSSTDKSELYRFVKEMFMMYLNDHRLTGVG